MKFRNLRTALLWAARLRRSRLFVAVFVTTVAAGGTHAHDFLPPRLVKVLPVFFVPRGEAPPTAAQSAKLMRHLEWARRRYAEMLPGRETFAVEEGKPRIYRSTKPLAFYTKQPSADVPQLVGELLTDVNYNRYNCPYVFLVILMNSHEDVPRGGGRTLNGGYNTGGGVLALSSFGLDRVPYFQSTLQHELGHSFGLPHVDVYGYDMQKNDSIMSYKPEHHTKGFSPGTSLGCLIPEDLRGLALNLRVFPNLRFDPARDIPNGYHIAERVIPLGPMEIPGQPNGVRVTTDSGEDYGSKVSNIVQNVLLPSKETGRVTYDAKQMWQSAPSKDGWVSVQVEFPAEVELSAVGVHSQHSGQYNPARAFRAAVRGANGQFTQVTETPLKTVDETVPVPRTKGKTWRFDFQAGESRCVTIRGLQFFDGDEELFPPQVPLLP
jgi:hypothetical protein